MPRKITGLFGGEARSLILYSLVTDGPSTRRSLAWQLGIDPTFALQRLRSLEDAGLVERRSGQRETVAFNWTHPTSNQLAAVVARYTKRSVPVWRGPRKVELPNGYLSTFGAPGRTRLLLALADGEPVAFSVLVIRTTMTIDALRSAARSLEKAGIVYEDSSIRPRTLRLAPRQPAFDEIRALLERLADLADE